MKVYAGIKKKKSQKKNFSSWRKSEVEPLKSEKVKWVTLKFHSDSFFSFQPYAALTTSLSIAAQTKCVHFKKNKH